MELSTAHRVPDLWVNIQGQREVHVELCAPHRVPDPWVNIQGQRGVDVELCTSHRGPDPWVCVQGQRKVDVELSATHTECWIQGYAGAPLEAARVTFLGPAQAFEGLETRNRLTPKAGVPPTAGLHFRASGTAGSASELALNFRRSPA